MNSTKQVIVMRRKFPDGKGGVFSPRTGKLIAQACHASIAFLSRRINSGEKLTKAMEEWLAGSFAKICLYVDTEEELLEIYQKSKNAGLEVHLVTDSGRTEFAGILTHTCLAIGPDENEKIDKITNNLKLL